MKVVIVEDDAVMALLLEEVCRTSGHQVVGIASGADSAIRLLELRKPDCLLLDFSLAGDRNGLQLLEEAKRFLPSLFCVMITAWDINDIAGRIGTVQPDRILRKPIHTETLAGILSAKRGPRNRPNPASVPRMQYRFQPLAR